MAPRPKRLSETLIEDDAVTANDDLLASIDSRGLVAALERAVADCRACRDELAVALIDFNLLAAAQGRSYSPPSSYLAGLVARVCREFGVARAEQFPLADVLHAVVMPHCSRREAIDLIRHVFAKADGRGSGDPTKAASGYSAGVASVDAPPKNFEPSRLLEAAQRCLVAARTSGGQIKSLEIS